MQTFDLENQTLNLSELIKQFCTSETNTVRISREDLRHFERAAAGQIESCGLVALLHLQLLDSEPVGSFRYLEPTGKVIEFKIDPKLPAGRAIVPGAAYVNNFQGAIGSMFPSFEGRFEDLRAQVT